MARSLGGKQMQLIAIRYKKENDIGYIRTEFPLWEKEKAEEFYREKEKEGYSVIKQMIETRC